MRILFDQGVPSSLRRSLTAHEVSSAYEREWSLLANGELLEVAEASGFDVFVTTDTNLEHQQNLSNRRLSVVVHELAEDTARNCIGRCFDYRRKGGQLDGSGNSLRG